MQPSSVPLGPAKTLDTAAWAHALAAPIAALEVLAENARGLEVAQQALLKATLARLRQLQQASLGQAAGAAADAP